MSGGTERRRESDSARRVARGEVIQVEIQRESMSVCAEGEDRSYRAVGKENE